MTAPDARIVFHECGHAVAAYLHGGRTTYLSALPHAEQWAGICSYRVPDKGVDWSLFNEIVIACAGPFSERDKAAAEIITALELGEDAAGFTDRRADCLHDDEPLVGAHDIGELRDLVAERWDRNGKPTDNERLNSLVASIANSDQEAGALKYWLVVRASEFVMSEKFCYLLDRLARLLLHRGQLSGAAATIELQRAELRYDDRSQADTWEPEAA
jgi:hypothetical protein